MRALSSTSYAGFLFFLSLSFSSSSVLKLNLAKQTTLLASRDTIIDPSVLARRQLVPHEDDSLSFTAVAVSTAATTTSVVGENNNKSHEAVASYPSQSPATSSRIADLVGKPKCRHGCKTGIKKKTARRSAITDAIGTPFV